MTPTSTPLQVLPSFVDVLGRKIDKISAEQDRVLGASPTWINQRHALKNLKDGSL